MKLLAYMQTERDKLAGVQDGSTEGAIVLDSMNLVSTLANQKPAGLDTVMPINFNPVNTSSANGSMSYDATSNKLSLNIGLYIVNLEVSYGRTGGAGESNLFFVSRGGPAGFEVESGTSLFAMLDNEKVGIPANITSLINVTSDGTQVDFVLWRDSKGHNSGGLFQTIPDRVGASTSPSASAFIAKIG